MIYSPLSYPGSKRRVMDKLLPLIPDGIEDWREPFFGSGSVTLAFIQSEKAKNLKKIIVGDLATEIWAFHQGCKTVPNEAVAIAKKWFADGVPTHAKMSAVGKKDLRYEELRAKVEVEGWDFWCWIRALDTTTLTLAERCARIMLMNRISYSGLIECGSLSRDRLCKFRIEQLDRIAEYSTLLQNIEILNAPFQETMANVDKDKTFVFLDPPYYTQEESGLYGKRGDTHKGFPHKEFGELVKSLPCKWLMTYDDSPFVRRLFRGFNIEPFQFDYTLAGNKSFDALAGEELLIANYDISSDASLDKDVIAEIL